MRHTKVGHVMTSDVATARRGTSASEAAALLARRGVSGLPVVDDEERVIGLLSGRDLRVRSGSGDGGTRTAGDLMSAPAVTVRADNTLAEAARWMAQRRVDRLPVVDDESRLVGIVTRRDLLGMFLRPDDDIARAVRQDVVTDALRLDPGSVDVDVRGGVVTLRGRLEEGAQTRIAVLMARQVDGVVAVVDRLTCEDTAQAARTAQYDGKSAAGPGAL